MAYATKEIKDLCSFSNGHGFTRYDWAKSGLPIIRIAHLNGSREFDYFQGKPEPDWIVEPGELLFAWAGTKGVSFGPTIWDGPRGVLNQHIFRVRPRQDVDKTWLYYALLQVTQRIEKQAHGFKSTLLHVRKSDVDSQRWPVPPLAEQRRIVNLSSLAEGSLTGVDGLLMAKRTFKRGLMQQLLTGQRRFPEFRNQSWKSTRLGDHVTQINRKNAHGVTLVLTASGEHGLVDQRTYFNRNVSGVDLSKYYHLKKGEFAYNRSAMNGYPYGATKRLDSCEEGVLSVLYLCFAISDLNLDSDFLKQVFDSGVVNRQLRPIVRVGARAHGLLNVTDEDYLSINIPFPKIEEQQRIAAFLTALDGELDLLAAQRERVELYKRGLLSRLLSGELKVPA
jgi:type I restriction enzyme, S subunit